jgi:hypothetical protein
MIIFVSLHELRRSVEMLIQRVTNSIIYQKEYTKLLINVKAQRGNLAGI